MYVHPNFKSKKLFKEAVARGDTVTVFSPGPFPANQNGKEFIEGRTTPNPTSGTLKFSLRTERS